MKTPQDIKAFVQHCKDIACEVSSSQGNFERIEVGFDLMIYVVFEEIDSEIITVNITPYLETPISELRAKRAERERLEQEKMDKYLTAQARMRLELERKEYERLKAKFEPYCYKGGNTHKFAEHCGGVIKCMYCNATKP